MPNAAVNHFDLTVSDLDASLAFYRGLLQPLGWTREDSITGERGERVVYLGTGESGRQVQLGLREALSHSPPRDRYAVGLHHIAFDVATRGAVDERHEWLIDHGAEIESEPREYDYGASEYYAVFFYDPDGIKLEVVYSP